jgi:hypothetical protein
VQPSRGRHLFATRTYSDARVHRERAFWIALALLVRAYAALPWTLDVVPGHDLPQHLAYARILRDLGDPALGLDATYFAVQPFDSYFAIHHVLAALGGAVGIVPACKIVYSVFAAALPLSAVAMCRAVWRSRAPWPALASTCLVWSPVACMGFLPFMLALPAVLFAVAAHARAARHPRLVWLAVAAVALAAVTCLHVVAAAMTLLFLALSAAFAWRRSAWLAFAAGLAGAGAAAGLLPGHGSRVRWTALFDDVLRYGPVTGTIGHFRMSWTGAGEKARLLFGTIPGPFTTNVKLALGGALLVVVVVIAVAPRGVRAGEEGSARTWGRAHLWASACFAGLAFVVPTAVQVPDDVCLVDLRMLVVAALLACASLPPSLLASARARVAGLGLAAAVLVAWSVTLAGLSREAAPVLHLVRLVGPNDRVLALAMHGSSEHLDPSNSLTHYLPVYALVERAAPVTSFWGDFAPHLPVGYRTPPLRPPDWAPWKVEPSHVAGATHVLLERSDDDDDDDAVVTTARLMRDPTLERIACEARWCLLRVRTDTRVTTHGTAILP